MTWLFKQWKKKGWVFLHRRAWRWRPRPASHTPPEFPPLGQWGAQGRSVVSKGKFFSCSGKEEEKKNQQKNGMPASSPQTPQAKTYASVWQHEHTWSLPWLPRRTTRVFYFRNKPLESTAQKKKKRILLFHQLHFVLDHTLIDLALFLDSVVVVIKGRLQWEQKKNTLVSISFFCESQGRREREPVRQTTWPQGGDLPGPKYWWLVALILASSTKPSRHL